MEEESYHQRADLPPIKETSKRAGVAVRTAISKVDPLRAAQAITADPDALREILRGNVHPQDVGPIFTRYAGSKPADTTEQWAKVTGEALKAVPTQQSKSSKQKQPQRQRPKERYRPRKPPRYRPKKSSRKTPPQGQVKAHMPEKYYQTLEEQTLAVYEDLCTYPDEQIKLLANKMRLSSPMEIAEKLVSDYNNKLVSVRGKCSRYTKKLDENKLDNVRSEIYNKFSKYASSVSNMNSKELHEMFKMYDDLCFDGDINKYMAGKKYSLRFKTSGEDTFTTEGICVHNLCNYTVTIPTEYFNNVQDITIVAGHPFKDHLECLLRVIEHELVHLIVFMFCGDPFITDQHGALFMGIANDLFGHTDHRHHIPLF